MGLSAKRSYWGNKERPTTKAGRSAIRKKPSWADSSAFKLAVELKLVKPGNIRCLRCQHTFYSVDISTNRICTSCEEINNEIILNENCEGEFLYVDDPEVANLDPSFETETKDIFS